jgi:hypothetical protein
MCLLRKHGHHSRQTETSHRNLTTSLCHSQHRIRIYLPLPIMADLSATTTPSKPPEADAMSLDGVHASSSLDFQE